MASNEVISRSKQKPADGAFQKKAENKPTSHQPNTPEVSTKKSRKKKNRPKKSPKENNANSSTNSNNQHVGKSKNNEKAKTPPKTATSTTANISTKASDLSSHKLHSKVEDKKASPHSGLKIKKKKKPKKPKKPKSPNANNPAKGPNGPQTSNSPVKPSNKKLNSKSAGKKAPLSNFGLNIKKKNSPGKSSKKLAKSTTNSIKNDRQKLPTVYLSNVPHGFYEEEMKSYFEQFGEVGKVRLQRSAKTGKSQGCAFIQFKHESVAKVAAETMNGYLMFKRLLKAEYVPIENVKTSWFRGKNYSATDYPTLKNRAENKTKKNKPVVVDQHLNFCLNQLKKIKKIKEQLKSVGLNYDFEPIDVPQLNAKPAEPTVDDVVDSSSVEPKKNRLSEKLPEPATSSEKDRAVIFEHHESDDDIQFKTPPGAIRVLKKRKSPRDEEAPNIGTKKYKGKSKNDKNPMDILMTI